MPKKIRQIVRELKGEGFRNVRGGGKGGHSKLKHPLPGVPRVIIPGRMGDDAPIYLEQEARRAIAAARAATSR